MYVRDGIVYRHWAAGNGQPFATKGTAAAANEEKAAETATAKQRRAMSASG
jgi:hypothetical protein